MMQNPDQLLSAEDLRRAGIKSFQNASELVDEAQLLFEHGHWSRAVFLCCISGEELGKCFISLSAIVNRITGKFDEKDYRQRFRTHREKTGTLTFFEAVFVSLSDKAAQTLDVDIDTQEKMKLASLYCDLYGVEAHAPSDLVNKELASEVLKLAKNRVKHFKKRIRPQFDDVVQVDAAEVARFQDEFLRAISVDVEADSDS
jgi:AbiV family abortive infection protein